jgi:hypothetical protein
MTRWLWLLPLLAVATLLVVITRALLQPLDDWVLVEYPRGVSFGGSVRRNRVTYVVVQWVRDPANPAPCPLILHLPKGDLGGERLCDWSSPQAAAALGSPVDLDLFPFHNSHGEVVGIRVGLLPGCPAVEVSIGSTRLALPLEEEDAVRLLGEPLQRLVSDSSRLPR